MAPSGDGNFSGDTGMRGRGEIVVESFGGMFSAISPAIACCTMMLVVEMRLMGPEMTGRETVPRRLTDFEEPSFLERRKPAVVRALERAMLVWVEKRRE